MVSSGPGLDVLTGQPSRYVDDILADGCLGYSKNFYFDATDLSDS